MPKAKRERSTAAAKKDAEPYKPIDPHARDTFAFLHSKEKPPLSIGGGGTVSTVVSPKHRTKSLLLGEGTHTVVRAKSLSLGADELLQANDGKAVLAPHEWKLLSRLMETYNSLVLNGTKIDHEKIIKEAVTHIYMGNNAVDAMKRSLDEALDIVENAWFSNRVRRDSLYNEIPDREAKIVSNILQDVFDSLDVARNFFQDQHAAQLHHKRNQ